MADIPISDLSPLGAKPATNDIIPFVDVSNTSQAPTGTTMKMTVANLFTDAPMTGAVTVTGTLAVSGNVTVNTNKMILTASTGDMSLEGDLSVGDDLGVTGDAAVVGNVTIDGSIFSTKAGVVMQRTGATTSAISAQFQNTTGDTIWGTESSTGGSLFSGTTAYASVFGTATTRPVQIVCNNTVSLTVDGSSNVTVNAGTLTVTGGGITHHGTNLLATTVAMTNGAGGNTGTLTNSPLAGNPTKWFQVDDNGTIRRVPAW